MPGEHHPGSNLAEQGTGDTVAALVYGLSAIAPRGVVLEAAFCYTSVTRLLPAGALGLVSCAAGGEVSPGQPVQ